MTAIILDFDDFRSARGARPGGSRSGPAANGVDADYPPMPFEAGNCEPSTCAFMALGPEDDTIAFLPGLFAAPHRE